MSKFIYIGAIGSLYGKLVLEESDLQYWAHVPESAALFLSNFSLIVSALPWVFLTAMCGEK